MDQFAAPVEQIGRLVGDALAFVVQFFASFGDIVSGVGEGIAAFVGAAANQLAGLASGLGREQERHGGANGGAGKEPNHTGFVVFISHRCVKNSFQPYSTPGWPQNCYKEITMAQELVRVFRSADESAAADAADTHAVLIEAGFPALLRDDKEPGVPTGVWEVCVPAEQEEAALAALAAARQAEPAPDASHALDMETLFEAVGTTAEVEALGITTVLEAAGIPNELVAGSQMPNLPFAVKVPKSMVEQARAALAEAQQAGPAAAEEAEETTEPNAQT